MKDKIRMTRKIPKIQENQEVKLRKQEDTKQGQKSRKIRQQDKK